MPKHTYPFSSYFSKDNLDLEAKSYVWQKPGFDLQEHITTRQNTILEIGGPTDTGYYFLDGVELSSKPLITNISDNPAPFHEDKEKLACLVKKLVDGRNTGFENEDVSIVLMASMSYSYDKRLESGEYANDNDNYILGKQELLQFSLGLLESSEIKHSQRVQIYEEAYRILEPSGLLLADGELEDMIAVQKVGFQIMSFIKVNYDNGATTIEFAAQKPA